MTSMSQKRLSIVLSVIGLVIEVTAIVVLVPKVFGPAQSAPDPVAMLMVPLIIVGVVLGMAAWMLRRRSKAATRQ